MCLLSLPYEFDGFDVFAISAIRVSQVFFYFFYLLFNQTPVAKEQIMEFSGGEGACTQPT